MCAGMRDSSNIWRSQSKEALQVQIRDGNPALLTALHELEEVKIDWKCARPVGNGSPMQVHARNPPSA